MDVGEPLSANTGGCPRDVRALLARSIKAPHAEGARLPLLIFPGAHVRMTMWNWMDWTAPRAAVSALTLAFAVAATPLAACDGGLNQNLQGAGNQDGGVALAVGDLAVDPTGSYFLARVEDKLMHADVSTGEARLLPGLRRPGRLAFDHGNHRLFVVSGEGGGELLGYSLAGSKVDWRLDVEVEGSSFGAEGVGKPWIEVTADDRFVLLAGDEDVKIIDAQTGSVQFTRDFEREVVDVDVSPDGQMAYVTLREEWEGEVPYTTLLGLDLVARSEFSLEIPNCADELTLSPDGREAFLAPTFCGQDPVSVIDLDKRFFVRNLPGFGPAAMSPFGDAVVAFMDMDAIDESLFLPGEEVPDRDEGQYRLMVIHPSTLEFESVAIGDSLPRYALTPDGNVLLVDSSSWFGDDEIRLLDVHSMELREVAGPDVRLDNFVILGDSRRAFLIDRGLYELDLVRSVVSSVALFFEPTNVNLTPDDQHLLLRESDTRIWIYGVDASQPEHLVDVEDLVRG